MLDLTLQEERVKTVAAAVIEAYIQGYPKNQRLTLFTLIDTTGQSKELLLQALRALDVKGHETISEFQERNGMRLKHLTITNITDQVYSRKMRLVVNWLS